MDDNTIKIEDLSFNLEDEELNGIEYLEILTMDEIIKNNPSFIAFTKAQIYDELYNMFKNKNKSNGFIELFYEIIENNKKIIDTTNYIIKTDAIKKDYVNDESIDDFIKTIKKLNRIQYILSQNEKNRLFFALSYDEKTEKLRFKADTKTNIQLYKDSESIKYPVYPSDDTNIPIESIYYEVPQSTINDYLNVKIMSHLYDKEKINETDSRFFTKLNKLLKDVKPEIPLDKIVNDDLLDYNNINSILNKYNFTLDFIKKKDFEKLKAHLDVLLKQEKEEKVIYNPIKIKDHVTINNKFTFFDNLQNMKNLLLLSDKVKENYDLLYNKLQDDKMSASQPPLLYNNIHDIVEALNTSAITIDDVSDNIKTIKKSLILDYAIKTIDILKTIDIEKVTESIDNLISRYMLVKNSINEVSNFHFVNFYNELKEIKKGNDSTNYESIPTILKKADFEEFEELEDLDSVPSLFIIEDESKKENILEKYWLSMRYRDELGFIEMLKIILPYISKIQDISKLQINYDLLCDNLFNKFRGIPNKLNILKKYSKDIADMTHTYQNDIIKLTPKSVFSLSPDIETTINRALVETNKEFVIILTDILYESLSWWSLQLQKEIIDDIIIFDKNELFIPCIDMWDLHGLPLEKGSKKGILSYLCCISEEVFKDDDNYIKISNKLVDHIMSIIEKNYEDDIKKLRDTFKITDAIKKKQKKGIELQQILVNSINTKQFDKLVNDYVNALLYMPGVKQKQIHKYLLGCCLQKIDNNFIPDSDLIGARKDLMVVKNKYSKNRATIRPRNLIFLPTKKISDDDEGEGESEGSEDESESEDNFDFKIKHLNTEMITGSVEEWLIELKDKNPLLPDKIILDLLENTKPSLLYIENYLKYLTLTSRTKKSDLISLFIPEKINYKNILLTISTILYKTEAEDRTLLTVSIETINNMLEHINKLNAIINDENKVDINRIKAYITARAMCLPCNPESNIGGLLKASVKTPMNFIENISKNIHDAVLQILKTNKIPTLEENVEFINSIREKNKNQTLSIMNKKTMEERNIINELKKLGIPNIVKEDALEDLDADVDIVITEEHIINDDEGEDDFKVEDEEHDYGDKLYDGCNYGFIYS